MECMGHALPAAEEHALNCSSAAGPEMVARPADRGNVPSISGQPGQAAVLDQEPEAGKALTPAAALMLCSRA